MLQKNDDAACQYFVESTNKTIIIMNEQEMIKEIQRSLSMLIEDEELKRLMIVWVKSGMSPEQVANHVRELVVRYVVTEYNV